MSRVDEYRAAADKIRRDAFWQPIKVLVWGPGDPGGDAPVAQKQAFQKREQIRQEIRNRFRRAEVFFSEDREMVELARELGGQLRKEAVQARLSDVIIMLDIGRGVDLELDHFIPTYSWFPRKVAVLLPEKYVNTQGLVKEILDYLLPHQIIGFTDDEFAKCSVATDKAIQPALGAAIDYLLKHGAGG